MKRDIFIIILIMFFLLNLLPVYSVVSDGLVSCWDHDSNTDFPDYLNINNGTASGAVYTSSGKIDGGYSFDESNDYITFANDASITPGTGNFSFQIWIKTSRTSTSLTHRAILLGKNNNDVDGWYFRIRDGSNAASLYFWTSNTVSNYRDARVNKNLYDETWYHVVGTKEGPDAADLKIYINGVMQSTTHGSAGSTPDLSQSSAMREGIMGNGIYPFGGIADISAYWNRTLTSEEVTTLYNSSNGIPCASIAPVSDTLEITELLLTSPTPDQNLTEVGVTGNTTDTTPTFQVSTNIAATAFDINGSTACTNTTGDMDVWTCTQPTALTYGSHSITINGTDGTTDVSITREINVSVNYNISECTIITEEGSYEMINNITDGSTTNCIDIQANNVTFDCKGYTIDSDGSTFNGIRVERSTVENVNVTIQNCIVNDWVVWTKKAGNITIDNVNVTDDNDWAFTLDEFDNSVLRNSVGHSTATSSFYASLYLTSSDTATIEDSLFYVDNTDAYNVIVSDTVNSLLDNIEVINGSSGIFMSAIADDNTITNSQITNAVNGIRIIEGDGNTIHGNIIEGSSTVGISIPVGISNPTTNVIYNNLLNNTVNVDITTSLNTNSWNVAPITGTRIFSNGTQIGGNYYTNSSGTGLSDSCTDSNTDGFCDSPYDLEDLDQDCSGSVNCDNYPLSNKYVTPVASTCDCSSIQAGTTIDCSENCIVSACDANGQDINIIGEGSIQIGGDITNHSNVYIAGDGPSNKCIVTCSGGCFQTT